MTKQLCLTQVLTPATNKVSLKFVLHMPRRAVTAHAYYMPCSLRNEPSEARALELLSRRAKQKPQCYAAEYGVCR